MSVNLLDDGSIRYVLQLSLADDKFSDRWDKIAEGYNSAIVSPIPALAKLKKRATCWLSHTPSATASGRTPQGKLMAAMLGMDTADPIQSLRNAIEDSDMNDCRAQIPELNKEQRIVATMMLSEKPGLIVVQAPPGTGKTFVMAKAIKRILESDETAKVLIVTHSNVALGKLVAEVIPLVAPLKTLVLLSAMAKQLQGHLFSAHRGHLLIACVEELLSQVQNGSLKLKQGLVTSAKNYQWQAENRPKLAEEKSTAELVIESLGSPRIVFSTTAMVEDLDMILETATHVVVDEAGQTPLSQFMAILVMCHSVIKVVLSGDIFQLLNYTEDIPKSVLAAANQSLLKYALELSPDLTSQAQLVVSHRSHPDITKCLAAAMYGEGIKASAAANQRTELTACASFALPWQACPIVLLHQEDIDEKEKFSSSRNNPSQAHNAGAILNKLAKALPETVSITCMCLYAGELKKVRPMVAGTRVRLVTVDGFQSQESDVTYVLTTRSASEGDIRSMERRAVERQAATGQVQSDPLGFVKNARRTIVALSRARSGLFVHGNLKLLATGRVWNLFLKEALVSTFAVDPREYADNCHRLGFEFSPLTLEFPPTAESVEVEHRPTGPEVQDEAPFGLDRPSCSRYFS
jgi:hypothetical protein